MARSKPNTRVGSLRIVGIYAACASLWILLSDRALCLVFQDPAQIALIGTLKGWVFVAVTSLLLFILLTRECARLTLPDEGGEAPSTLPPRYLIIAFTLLSLGLVVVGWAVYSAVAESIRKQEIERLNIIAEFKRDQIDHWLAERRGDILSYMESPSLIEVLHRQARNAEVPTLGQLGARMERVRRYHGYVGIEILGFDGRTLVSVGEAGQHGPEFEAAVHQAIGSQEPILLDLYRSDPSAPIRLAYVAAVRDTGRAERPTVGVLVFTADPESTLYPMLGSWPAGNRSGETLITRRDGDGVLYLSNLRHRPNAPLSLRFPLSRSDLPSVQAIKLGSGVHLGRDDRDVPVLSATLPVAGTPWTLVAKIDYEEVFANVQTAGKICAALIVVGIAFIGVLVAMAWRQQRLRDQIERRSLQDQLAKVAGSVPGVICSYRLRPDGHTSLPIASPAFADICGLDPEEVADNAEPLFARMLPKDAERVKASVIESARTMTPWHDEFLIRHPVKGERWIEGHSIPKLESDGAILWHGYLHDVTERKQADIELAAVRAQLQLAQSAAGLGWWEWSIDTGAQSWSPANYALHGLDPAIGPVTYETWFAAVHPEDRDRAAAAAQAAVDTGSTYEMEYRVALPGGEVRWLIGRGKLLTDRLQGTRRMLGINLDITAQKQTEIALAQANRLLRARHLSNLALLRATDEMSYLHSACEVVIDVCGYFMMWVGYADSASERRVVPVAVAGLDEGYLDTARITWADDEYGRGPTGTAIRTGRAIACQDMLADAQLEPWRDRVLKHGYRSSLALPLIAGSEALGALTVYSAKPNAFPEDEIELLNQIAEDFANGISVLRLRAAHASTEQALRESERKLRLFIEHAPSALAMFDTDMRYLFASRRWLTDYHLEASDITGKSHYEIFPEIPERWKEIHRRCQAGAVERCEEDPFIRLDGRTDWLRWAIHPWYKDGGDVGGIVVMSEQITEQVEIRQALSKLTLAVEQSPASILITDVNGNIEYVNETFTRVSGYALDDVLGRSPSFLGSGRTTPEIFRELWDSVRRGVAWRGELYNRRKSGEEYVESVWISPVRQPDGSVTHYLAIQEDITEQKRTEEELAHYRLHLEDLVAERTRQLQESGRLIEERAAEIADLYNNAPCGYHSLDSTGQFVRVNDTELSWLGYARDEVVGKMRFSDLLDEDGKARFTHNLARFLAQGFLYDVEYDLWSKDGRAIPIVLSATAIRGENGEVLMSRVIVYNLTDIKKAEMEAHRHARLAEAFFEHSVACLVILDRDYNFLRVNSAYARACRQEIGDYAGRNHFEMYPSDTKLIFDDVVRTKRPFETFTRAFEFPDQPERGMTYWDWTLVPILDQLGEVEFLVFSLAEVTERKRAEEALRESEALYRTLFDRSPDGIVLIDPKTARPIEFNTSAHESLGYGRDEFAALRLPEIAVHKSELEIRSHIERIAASGGDDFEIVHRTRDGEERNRTISVRTLEIRGRTVLHAIWHDITEIRRAQTIVEENERRLREITATLGEGLHVVDERGRIVFSNPAACRLLGWNEEEMLDAPGHQFIHARRPDGSHFPAEECPLYLALLSDQALINHEDAFWTKDGRLLPVSVTMTTIHRDGRVAGAVLAFQDITLRRQHEAELQRYRDGLEVLVAERTAALRESNRDLADAKDKAEAANLAKSTFLANMSHELRTPLSAILGFSQLLEMNTAAGMSEDSRLSIDHILKNGRYLLALINDLLDLAKIDAGQVSFSSDRIVLSGVLADLEASLAPLADAAGIVVSLQPAEGLPDVRSDGIKLNQVLLNLGSNAIKYNRPAGRVDIICELLDSEWVRLVFEDTGPGIPEERRQELFAPFNRLGRETGPIEGTGIGLALSRKLIELMGGRIGYSSRPEGGSRFWIDIPVHRSEDGIDQAPVDASTVSSAPFVSANLGKRTVAGSRVVLCVDDSSAGMELVALVIGRIPGTSLLTAGTAEAGIDLAKRHRPALILMDINLPGMDGFAALAELRRYPETRDIPVFALSAAATAADIGKGLEAGFDRYLTKPYDIHDLMAAVAGKLQELIPG